MSALFTPDLSFFRPAICVGAGSLYTAPGWVTAVYVNGLLQRPGIDYGAVAAVIELTYETGDGDVVTALCTRSFSDAPAGPCN